MASLKASEILSGKVAEPQGKICGHEGCKKPLGPRVDGEHNKIGGVEVCEDCYYDSIGTEMDNFPIGGHGIRRRG